MLRTAWTACLAVLCFVLTFVQAAPPTALLATAAKSRSGVFDLDTASFNKIVNEGISQRQDYSLAILFTALNTPGLDCAPCKTFQPVYEDVAAAWKNKAAKTWGNGKAGHYFAVVNFPNGREVFGQLQLAHAPVLMFLPPGAPIAKAVQYDFNQYGIEAEAFAGFVSAAIGKPVGYSKPFPWRSVAVFSLAALVATSVVLFAIAKLQATLEESGGQRGLHWRTVVTWVFQLLSLAVITIMCSGYMWNNIRNAPYLSVGGDGKIEYFAGGFQNQHGVETQIVAGIYGLLAFSLIALTVLVPSQRDPVKQRAGVYVWSIIFLAGVSVLFAVFRIKNPSYPFRLFL
ncbi:unnamed protein product [Parajaminaea phylloscopi]